MHVTIIPFGLPLMLSPSPAPIQYTLSDCCSRSSWLLDPEDEDQSPFEMSETTCPVARQNVLAEINLRKASLHRAVH